MQRSVKLVTEFCECAHYPLQEGLDASQTTINFGSVDVQVQQVYLRIAASLTLELLRDGLV